ncbi:MAG TPA: hypothetical protein VGR20_08335 [Acidimicrobiia bacterium]|jgi:hypothetical protein|nr:hypothetical protein [Acidimicrobiia bacterium]
MGLSSFDKRLLAEGLAYFSQPRLASLLEMLGRTEAERVEALTAMLRNSSEEEFYEALDIFERALARVAREQPRAPKDDRGGSAANEPRSRRHSPSAERREQRRRSS